MKVNWHRLKKEANRIQASKFSKNSLLLIGGTAISQLIPIGISPLLTRIYTPKEFGVLALFVSIAKIISVFSTGRYEPAIVLPKKDKEALNLMAISLLFSAVISLVVGMIVFVFQTEILSLLNVQSMGGWLLCIAPAAFLMSVVQVFYYWLTRKKAFSSMSFGKVFQAASAGGVQLGGYNGGLIAGNVVGQFIIAAKYFVSSFQAIKLLPNSVSKKGIKENMVRYKNFPLVSSIHRFFDLLQSNVLVSVISSLFSSAVLGFYSMTTRTLLAPAALVGSAVGNVFYQKAAELYQSKVPLGPLVKKILLILSLLGIVGFGILFIAAESVFSIAFGDEWVVCATYTRVLAPWLLLNFISSPISGLVNILGKQKKFFIISAIGNTIAVLLFLVVGTVVGEIFWSLLVFSAVMTVYTVVYVVTIYSTIIASDKAIL